MEYGPMTIWDRPLEPQGPSRDSPCSFQGVPGSPTVHRKDANELLRFADLLFWSSSVAFCLLWRSDLSSNAIKTNVFYNFETHNSLPFLCFSYPGTPRGPPRPLLESSLTALGPPRTPLKLGKGSLGRPGPLLDLLLR